MTLDSYIEAILFFKSTPVTVSFLSKVLGKKIAEVEEALNTLEAKLMDRGLRLIRHENKVALGTAPKASGFVEGLIKADLDKDIGKAGLETLSVVMYKGPISRSAIDHVRGVNSSFILRNLLVRGLIEKIHNPKDQRSSLYKPAFKLLSYLGIKNIEEMPEYKKVREDIENFEKKEEERDGKLL